MFFLEFFFSWTWKCRRHFRALRVFLSFVVQSRILRAVEAWSRFKLYYIPDLLLFVYVRCIYSWIFFIFAERDPVLCAGRGRPDAPDGFPGARGADLQGDAGKQADHAVVRHDAS